MPFDAAKLSIKVDSSDLKKGDRELKKFGDTGEKTESRVGKSMKGIAVAAGAAVVAMAALAKVAKLVGDGAKEIDRVAKASRRLDTSIKGFRAMELAAGEAGVSISALTNDVQTMERELANIGKTGNAQRALDDLGLSMRELTGLEADQKLAVIADSIQEMGLSAGETTAVLRDLGVRNREMVLALLDGGDVFREASKDIEDYGLAISGVDASAIEAANDAIGRISLISTYLSQQLSLLLTPAMGAMAKAMTDSLREGGLLREVIDGLVATVKVASNIIGSFATILWEVSKSIADALKYVWELTDGLGGIGRAIAAEWNRFVAIVKWAYNLVTGFADLIKEAGSFGAALTILGDVAVGVFKGMVTAAGSIPDGLASVWLSIKADFFAMVADLMEKWGTFVTMLSGYADMFKLDIFKGYGLNLLGKAAEGATKHVETLSAASKEAASQSAALGREARNTANKGFDEAAAALGKLNTITNKHSVDTDRMMATMLGTKKATDSLATSLAGSGGGGAAGAAKQVTEDVEDMNIQLEQSIPIVDEVAGAFADFVMRGFKDFKSFTRSIVDSFKKMLTEMIAMAARNTIMLSIGGGGSVAGSAAGAAGSLMGGGGAAGGLGSFGAASAGLGSAFVAGAFNAGSALMSGGLSGMAGSIGAQVGAAAAGGSMASIAAAAGAVALPLLAVGGIFMALKKKTKILDQGLTITADNFDTFTQSFTKKKTSRLFGLVSNTSTKDGVKETSGPIVDAVEAIKKSGVEMGKVLGLTADNFASFNTTIKLSLKDLSEADAQAEIERAMGVIADQFSYAALGHFQEIYGNVIHEGEGAGAAMERLANSLLVVNDVTTLFGQASLDASVAGGVAASALADLTGGLEAFGAKSAYVFENFLTDMEREMHLTAIAIEEVNAAFGSLGIAVPQTHAAFMEIANAQDLMTESGRATYAALMNVAGAFVQLHGTAQQAADGVVAQAKAGNDVAQKNYDAQAAIVNATQNRIQALERTLSSQQAAVQRARQNVIRAEETITNLRLAAQKELERAHLNMLQEALRAAQNALRDLEAEQGNLTKDMESDFASAMDIADGLAKTAREVMGISEDMAEIQRVNAMRQLKLMLATGKIDRDRLDDLTGAATRFGDQYESEVDLLRAQTKTAATIAALSELQKYIAADERELAKIQIAKLDQQIAIAEAAVGGVQAQIDAIEAASEAERIQAAALAMQAAQAAVGTARAEVSRASAAASQTAQLISVENQQLGMQQTQLGVLRNILTATNAAYTQADAVADAKRQALGDYNRAVASGSNQVDALYRNMLGEEPSASGKKFWEDTGFSGSKLVNEFRKGAIKDGRTPRFARGGSHIGGVRIVGEHGPELEATGPSRIFSAKQTQNMMKGDGGVETKMMRAELTKLNQYVRELVKVNNKQERSLKEIQMQGEPV